ncbi:PulJ/GspJ family protein [Aestuariibacter salexigens]|uniref:PulJ/GspJ family protein n=1 Tax=Aestuariibacter salexigens TaxID=226010 RepID=UPI00041FE9DA|nr:prepilin-type N-terminal cleavage/methylation domain-containing protein [Aestuariibacter salexigens]
MLHYRAGFTLIELVTVIALLGAISIGVGTFLRNTTQAYLDVSEREQLLGDSRFVVERLNREIRAALPASLRVTGNSDAHCVEFVPIQWSTFYTSLPTRSADDGEINVVELFDIDGNAFSGPTGMTAFIYPTRNQDVYDASLGRQQEITACTDDGDGDCVTQDDADGIVQLSVEGPFTQRSPASRVYIASTAVSYCARNNAIYRHEGVITQNQTLYTSGGVLMAENLVNTLSANPRSQSAVSDDPFRVYDATLTRNAVAHLRLRFARGGELITFNNEVHIPNVP